MATIEIDGVEYEAECNPRRFGPWVNMDERQERLVTAIKLHAESLSMMIDMTPNRESSIAMTHLETAVMWAVKGVCKGVDGKVGSPEWLARMGIGAAE